MGRNNPHRNATGLTENYDDIWKRKRKERIDHSAYNLPKVDVHGILFAVVAVVFVVYPYDGQNTQKAGKLRKNWHAVETHATAYADLVLAVRSAYFIGNPASSFSANVVMIRRALGAAPTSTNLRVLDFPRPGSYK